MKKVKLKEILEFSGGGTPDRGNALYWDGTIPWASVKDIKSKYITETQESITEKGLQNSASRIAPIGSIVIATRMALGKASIVKSPVAINQDLKCITFRSSICCEYIYYFLISKEHYFEKEGKGATVKGVTLDVLKELEIPFPPLAEQRRIAAILDKADAIRRKRQQAIVLADEFLKSVFLDMFGDPATNPKGWDTLELCEVAEILSGVTKGKKYNGQQLVSVPYMRVANVQDGHILLNDIKHIDVTKAELQRYELAAGDILLTEGGDPDKLGRGAIWQGEVENCIHQNHIFRVRITAKNVIPDYLNALVGSQYGKRYFMQAAKQTTGIASINKTQLSKFPAQIPPLDRQKKFAYIVHKVEAHKQRAVQGQQEADDLFKALQQQFFS